MNQLVNSVVVILSAIVGVAILSVILSKNSNTTSVIGAGASGFAQILGAAEAPITGSTTGGVGFGSMNFSGGY